MIYIGDDGKWHIGPGPQQTSNRFMDIFFNTESGLLNITNAMVAIFISVASIVFIIGAINLAMSSGNPLKKQHAYEKIKLSLIGIALLGAFATITNLAYNMFN